MVLRLWLTILVAAIVALVAAMMVVQTSPAQADSKASDVKNVKIVKVPLYFESSNASDETTLQAQGTRGNRCGTSTFVIRNGGKSRALVTFGFDSKYLMDWVKISYGIRKYKDARRSGWRRYWKHNFSLIGAGNESTRSAYWTRHRSVPKAPRRYYATAAMRVHINPHQGSSARGWCSNTIRSNAYIKK